MNIKIKVDEVNRVVIATTECPCGCERKIKSIAKCSPEDEFNKEFGIKLAKAKLYHKLSVKERNHLIKILAKAIAEVNCLDRYLREESLLKITNTQLRIQDLLSKIPSSKE